ncbi:hypothetical protein HS1genome_0670 [Sulfodiicoccus acidiphilus]|uniref:Uncharacterized protein n=1 Tax=Sulfodiicoccus acidiphilus TaxID=1670455 RepID=A0A348B279_9CREN|nr:hypothetical protein [Sulfodiicoccus acidiphilus]BBD72281.1 hypothetical protein HS1genome_0670 [Sulfodiicoccus acidiphilus]GGT90576.1 hypothetical protein GCM10007116_05510 [Sulfodiicoccus acidiphilus]
MKTTLLAIALLLAGAGAGAAGAGVMGYGPLAYVSFHIPAATEQRATIIPAYLNLGNLSAGEKGNYTTNATVTLRQSGNYSIDLLHDELLSNLFSNFTVVVKVSGNVLILSPTGVHSDQIYLSNGTYTVNITVYYQVAQQPIGPSNVTNLPLLIIHPVGGGDHGDHHGDHGNGHNNQGADNQSDGNRS